MVWLGPIVFVVGLAGSIAGALIPCRWLMASLVLIPLGLVLCLVLEPDDRPHPPL